MKFIISLILTALLGFAAPLYFPWWSIAITSFIVAFAMQQKPWAAFVVGFVGIFVLWALLDFIIDNKNEHLLSVKIANILPLGGSYALLILISAFEGALVSGCAALTGSLLRDVIVKRPVGAS